MVYRIRNTSFFWTKHGHHNNYNTASMITYSVVNPNEVFALLSKLDHYSLLRIHQSYRNMSRCFKKYLYGDQQAEQQTVLLLRDFFRKIYDSKTPVHLLKHDGMRMFADQFDRHYEIASYNSHPWQLKTYEIQNQTLARETEDRVLRENGQETALDYLERRVAEAIEDFKQETGSRKVSFDQIRKIVSDADIEARSSEGKPRRSDGEMNDYLEVRRPFIDPNPQPAH